MLAGEGHTFKEAAKQVFRKCASSYSVSLDSVFSGSRYRTVGNIGKVSKNGLISEGNFKR